MSVRILPLKYEALPVVLVIDLFYYKVKMDVVHAHKQEQHYTHQYENREKGMRIKHPKAPTYSFSLKQ